MDEDALRELSSKPQESSSSSDWALKGVSSFYRAEDGVEEKYADDQALDVGDEENDEEFDDSAMIKALESVEKRQKQTEEAFKEPNRVKVDLDAIRRGDSLIYRQQSSSVEIQDDIQEPKVELTAGCTSLEFMLCLLGRWEDHRSSVPFCSCLQLSAFCTESKHNEHRAQDWVNDFRLNDDEDMEFV